MVWAEAGDHASRAKAASGRSVAHQVAILVLDPYLDARRLGEVIENLRGLALSKLRAVKIDAHRDATTAPRRG
jgi:hypothetical protein